MAFSPSELIYNQDGSIFHLALHAEQIAHRIFLVGDPGRVAAVSRHFDRVEHKVAKREFITHTGWIGDQRLSVVSTGIGTDNIDIVLQELDILVNVDPATRMPREKLTALQLIRLGTSGAYQETITPGDVVVSEYALGLDGLMHFYQSEDFMAHDLLDAFRAFADEHFKLPVNPYAFAGNPGLVNHFSGLFSQKGITLTLPGFYGPQGRRLRAPLFESALWQKLPGFQWEDNKITNFEMESSGIYGLAALLGHKATSINLILANRIRGEFLTTPTEAMSSMIERVLSNLPPFPTT